MQHSDGDSEEEVQGQGRLSAVQLISSDCASALPPVADVCGIVLTKTQLQILLGNGHVETSTFDISITVLPVKQAP